MTEDIFECPHLRLSISSLRHQTMIWKILTLAFASISMLLLLLLLKQEFFSKRTYDPRLIGTWQSDKERTLEQFPKHMTGPEKEQLSSLFGKLRVIYTPTAFTTELDGQTETCPYTVLGVDAHSVVIRDDSVRDPDLEILEMSTFSKIHFDGPDSYWVITEFGGINEFFRRVSPSPE